MKAICWQVTRRDGQVMRATSLDADLVVTAAGYAGTYLTAAGIVGSTIKNSNNMAVDNLEVSSSTNADAQVGMSTYVSVSDIEGGLWDEARVKVFELDTSDLGTVRILVNGVMGQITRSFEGQYNAEVRNLFQLLNQQIGETISLTCRARLGSGAETPAIKRCGLDLTPFTVSGTVTSVLRSGYTWTDSSLTQPANWFRDGIVTWLTGFNAGYQSQVRRHLTGGQIVLDAATPFSINAGDTYSITPGCDKLFTTCDGKFNNAVNFRGEPYIPGIDALIAGEGTA